MTDRATAAADFPRDGLAAADFGARRGFATEGARTAPLVLALGGAFDAAADLATRTFLEARALRAPRAIAVCAALAFFRACFAAFLDCFDVLRAFFSSAFACRTCCFASSARRAASSAAAFSRRTAALFARAAVERVLATMVTPHKFRASSLVPGGVPVTKAARPGAALGQYTPEKGANVGDFRLADRVRHRVLMPLDHMAQARQRLT